MPLPTSAFTPPVNNSNFAARAALQMQSDLCDSSYPQGTLRAPLSLAPAPPPCPTCACWTHPTNLESPSPSCALGCRRGSLHGSSSRPRSSSLGAVDLTLPAWPLCRFLCEISAELLPCVLSLLCGPSAPSDLQCLPHFRGSSGVPPAPRILQEEEAGRYLCHPVLAGSSLDIFLRSVPCPCPAPGPAAHVCHFSLDHSDSLLIGFHASSLSPFPSIFHAAVSLSKMHI